MDLSVPLSLSSRSAQRKQQPDFSTILLYSGDEHFSLQVAKGTEYGCVATAVCAAFSQPEEVEVVLVRRGGAAAAKRPLELKGDERWQRGSGAYDVRFIDERSSPEWRKDAFYGELLGAGIGSAAFGWGAAAIGTMAAAAILVPAGAALGVVCAYTAAVL
eukprot:TRINITY_DN14625_c0_g1_i1.p1 TRINITY_DN14625_c0_g1~~TRINITY_DN14625_c0_g1_i1.p1  ORF type:complete len:160 (+),score=51.69 TRINITY_DN14625_c0_g1_i1:168-647(+)